MPIITNRKQVLAIYEEAANNKWVLSCFCSENLTTTEAILAAAYEYGKARGIPDLPIIVAITCRYGHRSQSTFYTHTRRWDIGFKLFIEDLKILAGNGSPYENLRIMVHLDHIQFDDDRELLSWDLNAFSSIMFDASKLPFNENIKLTREFVKENGNLIMIEGACDEIVDASGNDRSELTTAEKAYEYFQGTGVDMIVANLGTEHRASSMDLKYYGNYARSIKEKVGTRIVLHGASSVLPGQLEELFDDGVCKVNIWAAMERDSTPALYRDMVANASRVVGGKIVEQLKNEGLLGGRVMAESKASLDFFTTSYRQSIIYEEMKKIVTGYLGLWYR